MSSYLKSKETVLTRFDDYWRGWDGKHFERIIKKYVAEPSTRVQLLSNGEADFVFRAIPADLLGPLQKMKGVEVFHSYGTTSAFIFMNHQKFPTDNPKIREALWYALDYEAGHKGIAAGFFRPARGPIPTTIWGSNPDLETGTYNLDKARRLVEESGIPKDKLKMVYSYTSVNTFFTQYGQMLQSTLARIGIELELRGGPFFVHWTKSKKAYHCPQFIFDHVLSDLCFTEYYAWAIVQNVGKDEALESVLLFKSCFRQTAQPGSTHGRS